jgi:hypothetical protein
MREKSRFIKRQRRPYRVPDMTGEVCGPWRVESFYGFRVNPSGDRTSAWDVICVRCGRTSIMTNDSLRHSASSGKDYCSKCPSEIKKRNGTPNQLNIFDLPVPSRFSFISQKEEEKNLPFIEEDKELYIAEVEVVEKVSKEYVLKLDEKARDELVYILMKVETTFAKGLIDKLLDGNTQQPYEYRGLVLNPVQWGEILNIDPSGIYNHKKKGNKINGSVIEYIIKHRKAQGLISEDFDQAIEQRKYAVAQ